MAFGIEIINNNDRILIDNNYPNIGFVSTTTSTASPGSAYPGLVGNVASDLVVARSNTSSNGMVSKNFAATNWVTSGVNSPGGAPNGFIYYLLRRNDTLVTSQPGYGLEVYANTGNVIFTSNVTKNFEIITIGTFNSQIANTQNIAFPSSSTWYSDFTKYYCAINSTGSQYIVIPFTATLIYNISYRYIWANSSHGRIVVESFLESIPGGISKLNYDFQYMILKELT